MKMHRPGRARPQRINFLLILVCAAGALPASVIPGAAQEPPAGPQELTLEQYTAELERCASVIQRPSDVPNLQNSLPSFWIVRAGTKSVDVPTEAIRLQLRQLQLHPSPSGPAARALRQLVKAMEQEAEGSANSRETASVAKERPLLENILNRKEFRDTQGPSAAEILAARMTRRIVEMLARLLSKLHLGKKSGNIVAWGVIGLAFLSLCYLVWRWLSNRPKMDAALPVVSNLPSDARQWVQEALAAADRGDYRAALHCAYWGAIARLEDVGRLSRDRARTPRESLRLLEDRPAEYRLLHGITGIFERVWYGYRSASAADWTGARDLLEKIGCLSASIAPTASS